MTIKVRIGNQIVDYDPLADFGREVIKRLERAEKRRARQDAEEAAPRKEDRE